MSRLILLIPCVIGLHFTLLSQIPEGYYDLADGLSGEELKSALNVIIKGHTEFPYTSSSTDLWDILKESDRDTTNSNNVILFYTGWSVNAAQEYNNGSGWSREHVWAKSRGDFGTSLGPGTDAHHLRPADISVNSARNNRWFDTCSTPYLDGGLETGCYTSSSRWVWLPRDEVKGDVSRMIFYMATRYEGENGGPDLEVIDYIPSDSYTKDPIHAKLSALLAWHLEDPVDNFEQNRNKVVYSYQGNRNPFIDHPEYVGAIWDSSLDDIQPNIEPMNFRIYPNPTKGTLTIETKDIGEYSTVITTLNGMQLYWQEITNARHHVDLSSLEKGFYFISIRSKDLVTTKKIIKL
jgi:endonuclease I